MAQSSETACTSIAVMTPGLAASSIACMKAIGTAGKKAALTDKSASCGRGTKSQAERAWVFTASSSGSLACEPNRCPCSGRTLIRRLWILWITPSPVLLANLPRRPDTYAFDEPNPLKRLPRTKAPPHHSNVHVSHAANTGTH